MYIATDSVSAPGFAELIPFEGLRFGLRFSRLDRCVVEVILKLLWWAVSAVLDAPPNLSVIEQLDIERAGLLELRSVSPP